MQNIPLLSILMSKNIHLYSTITIVCIEIHINIYPVYISDYNLKLTNLDWILEQLDKPKVISSGQELSVLGETGGVDICDVTLWWPDPLARLP